MEDDQKLWLKARKRAEEKAGFFVHVGIYLAVNALMILTSDTTSGPGPYPWFCLLTAGRGIGVVGRFVSVFADEGDIEHPSGSSTD